MLKSEPKAQSLRVSNRLWTAALLCVAVAVLCLTGCGEKKSTKVKVPPPPSIQSEPEQPTTAEQVPATPGQKPSALKGGYNFPPDAKPLWVQTGIASWYGPPYHNRRSANGEIFDTYQLTAAHRTLPMNSVARITNVKTGNSTYVRITDRGPFIEGRVLDLSVAAAKAVDVWRAGLATVKIEVMQAPSPIDEGGRWCVQIGAFTHKAEATKLKEKLMRRYHTAQVLQFTGPTGDWIRVRPLNDEKSRAEELARDTKASEGAVFLVRLD